MQPVLDIKQICSSSRRSRGDTTVDIEVQVLELCYNNLEFLAYLVERTSSEGSTLGRGYNAFKCRISCPKVEEFEGFLASMKINA